ncbi:MAG: O-antigen ligase family protein [Oscillospiraceae bacterium]|nr:O-antigen ligase family protein [Oscillospiraceae bacterium]
MDRSEPSAACDMRITGKKKSDRESETAPERELEAVLLLSPFLMGLYYPWTSALGSVVLALMLFQRRASLRFSLSPCMAATSCTVLFLLFGAFRGTDRGMALVGAVQFLPLPLYTLLLEQCPPERRMGLFRKMPEAGCLAVLLSLLLGLLPPVSHWFWVNGRLAGFFQYPNTLAVYLLLCFLQLGIQIRDWPEKNDRGVIRRVWLETALLLIGIVLTGSKTVLLLLLGVLLLAACLAKNRVRRRWAILLGGILLAGGAGYMLLRGPISLSTFYGRLLYARDALPVILKHPLGLGYQGYSWLQGSFQTGLYSTVHVHNELMQLLLDAGWIPAGLFVWTILKGFLYPDRGSGRRLMLGVLCLHCLFDFDTQYPAMCFILLTLSDTAPIGKKSLQPGWTAFAALTAALCGIWIGLASFALWAGRPESAVRICPVYTTALVQMLPDAGEAELEELSDRILHLNGSAAIAHDGKARAAFADGRFRETLEHKLEAIRLRQYDLGEYLEYLDYLELGWRMYRSSGNRNDAAYCAEKMSEVPAMLNAVKAKTSALGYKIQEQPNLELPRQYLDLISSRQQNPA